MIGIDTNVLVRYIAQDDATQSAQATRLLEEECSPATPGYVALAELSGFAGDERIKCLIFHEVIPKGLHYTAAARATSSAVIFGGA